MWDSLTPALVTPAQSAPSFKLLLPAGGKQAVTPQNNRKAQKKALLLSLTLCDQVFCNLLAVLGTVPSAPAPTATAAFFMSPLWQLRGKNIDWIPLA